MWQEDLSVREVLRQPRWHWTESLELVLAHEREAQPDVEHRHGLEQLAFSRSLLTEQQITGLRNHMHHCPICLDYYSRLRSSAQNAPSWLSLYRPERSAAPSPAEA
jgi:hypothetical protein